MAWTSFITAARGAATFLPSLLLASCLVPRTQTMVVMNGDSVVREETTDIVVHVTSAKGVQTTTVRRAGLRPGIELFPFRLPIATRDANAWYLVEAEALKTETRGERTVITRLAVNRARSGFVRGRVLTLPLWLLSGCACDESQRCVPGPGMVPTCTDLEVIPEPEPEFSDAGAGDGAIVVPTTTCPMGFHLCGERCLPDGDVGSCGQRCTPCPEVDGGISVCVAGACSVRCSDQRQMCGAACIDTDTNARHCGACGNSCTSDHVCIAGTCAAPPSCMESNPATCPTGTYCRDGRCIQGCDENSDCPSGACNFGSRECGCRAGSRLCGGTCAVCPPDAASVACNDQNQCVATSCTPPQIVCGGSCAMESAQACGANCVSCAVANGVGACAGGSCRIESCNAGYRACAGVCALCPVGAESTSCAGQNCVAGSCAEGFAFCEGACVAESTSQCGASCVRCTVAHGTGMCTAGSCGVAACEAGYRACGGVCAACPVGATQTSCAGNQCVATGCPSEFALCNGQCVANSNTQCGASCQACTLPNGTAVCSGGVCGIATCAIGYRACAGACAPCQAAQQALHVMLAAPA